MPNNILLPSWEVFPGRETEGNWGLRDQKICAVIQELDSNGLSANLLAEIRTHYYDLLAVLHTPRTQLALNACRFFGKLAPKLALEDLEQLADPAITNLSKVCAGTRKIVAAAAQEALQCFFLTVHPSKAFNAVHLVMHDKNPSLRTRSVECLLALVNHRQNDSLLSKFWIELEPILIKSICDANPTVRFVAAEIIKAAQYSCQKEISQYFCFHQLY